MINKFDGEHRFLSNFYEWGFTYKGIYMPTAEHAFQAVKAKNPYDMMWVAEANTPGIAKRRGRQVNLRPGWDNDKLGEMLMIVATKFDVPVRKQMLRATGDQKLIEGNYWHDNFWGNCFCDNCPEPGRNYLGKILMYVRREYT